MRTTILLAAIASLTAGCLGEQGGPRKRGTEQGSGSDEPVSPSTDGPCAKVEKNITIRAAADVELLPKTGCYDIVGSLTIQSSDITTLAKLGDLNSVTDLDLDHTGLTRIDAKRTIGIYGRLTVTGNAQLTGLQQLMFKTASPGILIDGNPVLAAIEPFLIDTAQLTEVTGDVTITGNTLLGAVTFRHLSKVSGKLLISGNPALTTLDLAKLATTGGFEISDNGRLGSLTGLAATDVNGDLVIRNNAALTGLGAMGGLAHVSGDVTIDNNPVLTSLASFTTVFKRIDKGLTITNNRALTDVGALKHADHIAVIRITDNQNLVKCRAQEVDRCVDHDQGSSITNNRDSSCNTSCN